MSLLKALGIDKYTTRFKEWIALKYIPKGGLKTINNESIEGSGNIEISGGGSSVNADWNQNDSTQPDYIKNKPLTIPDDSIEHYTTLEFIESEEPTEDGYRFVSIRPIGDLTDEDSLIVKSFYSSVSDTEYKDDIYHFSFKEQIGIYEFTFDSVKVVLNFDNNFIEFRTNVGDTDRGEYLYKFTDSDIIYKIESCYIPDSIARKSDIVTPDWNAQEGEDGYIKNRTHYYKRIIPTFNGNNLLYTFTEQCPYIVMTSLNEGYEKIFERGKPDVWKTDYAGTVTEITVEYDGFASITLVDDYDDESTYPLAIEDMHCYVVKKQISDAFIPDTIARKSDLNTNTNTTKNITTDFGITIEDLLGDYNDYYTFWEYVTQGYNTINYNNDENTIAFPISRRENSEITGESIYIPYPDGQIEIYYSDGSGLGGKIIKTFVDPIVYKYLLNPYEVYVIGAGESDPIPEDLFNIINNNPNIAQKVIVINYENSANAYICHITGRVNDTFFISVEGSTYRMYINENRTIYVES